MVGGHEEQPYCSDCQIVEHDLEQTCIRSEGLRKPGDSLLEQDKVLFRHLKTLSWIIPLESAECEWYVGVTQHLNSFASIQSLSLLSDK